MKTFEHFVFFLTTAEDQLGHFIGEEHRPSSPMIVLGDTPVAPGVYRIEGESLKRIEPASEPPSLTLAKSGFWPPAPSVCGVRADDQGRLFSLDTGDRLVMPGLEPETVLRGLKEHEEGQGQPLEDVLAELDRVELNG